MIKEKKLQEKIAKEFKLDKLLTKNKELEKTKRDYTKEFDKWLVDLQRRNGITIY